MESGEEADALLGSEALTLLYLLYVRAYLFNCQWLVIYKWTDTYFRIMLNSDCTITKAHCVPILHEAFFFFYKSRTFTIYVYVCTRPVVL